MGSSLLDNLTKLASLTPQESFSDPFCENDTPVIPEKVTEIISPPRKKKKSDDPVVSDEDLIDLFDDDDFYNDYNTPKKKKSSLDKAQEAMEHLRKYTIDGYAEGLDGYLDGFYGDDEDRGLSNSLIGLGRKYARDTASSAESSEFVKAYSASERKLKDILGEIDKDKAVIDEIMGRLRLTQRAPLKSIAELASAKNSFHSSALSVIKEMNSIKKVQFELKMKAENARKDANEESTANIGSSLKSLFSLGRSDMIGSLGGYAAISGATDISDDESIYDSVPTDDEIEQTYLKRSGTDMEETDGDKFLKYEGRDVGYVLIISSGEDGESQYACIAEDRDGNYVPDYPIPSNITELEFDIDRNSMEATDQYRRQYKVRFE